MKDMHHSLEHACPCPAYIPTQNSAIGVRHHLEAVVACCYCQDLDDNENTKYRPACLQDSTPTYVNCVEGFGPSNTSLAPICAPAQE